MRADAVDAVSVASNAPCKSPAMQSSLSSSALRGGDLDFSLRAGKVEFAYRFPRLYAVLSVGSLPIQVGLPRAAMAY